MPQSPPENEWAELAQAVQHAIDVALAEDLPGVADDLHAILASLVPGAITAARQDTGKS